MRFLVLNGPNLNLLGRREPGIYGGETLGQLEERILKWAVSRGVEIKCRQNNSEGVLIDHLQDAAEWASGVVFNPGGYAHTSVALRDAVSAIGLPTVEVHISNVHAREDFRRHSLLSPVTIGQVVGFGHFGYILALEGLLNAIETRKQP